MAEQIVAAGREFGFFQVINHGVPEDVMGAMMSAAAEFFNLQTEEKMAYYSTHSTKLPRFHTSVSKAQEQVLYWRDCLKIGCYPFEEFRRQRPERPAGLGAVLEPYTAAVRRVALRVLRLAASGLGLADEAHFEGGEITAGPVIMNVNHYVACPDPSLTLGLAPHCHPNVVTVLMDNGVRGLQARRRRGEGGGGWVDVDPQPGVLVVKLRAPDRVGHQRERARRRAPRGDQRTRRAHVGRRVRHARDGVRHVAGAWDGGRGGGRGAPAQALHVPGVRRSVHRGQRRQRRRPGAASEQQQWRTD